MKNTYLLVFYFLGFIVSTTAQNVIDVAGKIDYNEYNKHLEYLASDELEGRNTGSEGYAKAADYVANEFQKNGLKPFGDNNTYFQTVPFIKQYLNKSSIEVYAQLDSKKVYAKYAEDISFLINKNFEKIAEKQELVFVGYGIIDSSLNINDYNGLDVEGKTVIVALGGPKKIKDYRFYDPFLKVRTAVEHGATGLILFYPKGVFQNMVFKQMYGFLGAPVLSLKDTSLKDQMFNFDIKIAAFAHRDFIQEVLKINNLRLGKELKKISKGECRSKELKSNITCNYELISEDITCKNVAGYYPGSDSILNKEYVIVGAHLDHEGIKEAVKGDSIYNGFWDNATGSAALISISKTFAEAEIKPERSLVFVCYTGEEKGLLGSAYFANHKDFGSGRMVANLNIDMLGGLFPTTDIIPMGYSHSNLSEAIDFAASNLNFVVDDNKEEENAYLFRSDQASFLKLGVPVINVANGYTAVDPKIDGKKEIDQWMKKRYHSPFDDKDQEYSKEVFLQALKLEFLTTYYITNKLKEIKWNENSWIYKRYVLKEE